MASASCVRESRHHVPDRPADAGIGIADAPTAPDLPIFTSRAIPETRRRPGPYHWLARTRAYSFPLMPGTAQPKSPSNSHGDEEYILGTGSEEATRLGLQHRLWSASAHLLWEQAAIRPGMTVLDVGCGPGFATADMAQIVGPAGRVIGVDESPTFLKQLNDQIHARRLHNVERVLGDVQELESLLGAATGTIDLAYARWVLCFVPKPERVIQGIARLLAPGGRVVIQDYFNYETMTLAPRREPFSRVIRAIGDSWRARGGDPDIMSRVPAMLREHGLEIEHLDVAQRIARPGTTMWHWPDSFWRTYLPRLVEFGHLTRAEVNAFDAAWAQASHDPDTFMFLPPVFGLIAVKR